MRGARGWRRGAGAARRFAADFRAHGGGDRGRLSGRTVVLAVVLGLAVALLGLVAVLVYAEAETGLLLGLATPPASPRRAGLRYWEKARSAGAEFPLRAKAAPGHDRYVTFEDDSGGWNNIRLAFEVFVLVAKVTGRVLVLPPRCRWYLLDRGPIVIFEKHPRGSTSGYEDYFDFALIHKHVQVITTEEFLRREAGALGVPDVLVEEASYPQLVSNGKHTDYFMWLRESKDAALWPTGPSFKADFNFFDPSLTDIHPEKKLLHFPMHVSQGWRYLAGVPALLRYDKSALEAHQVIRRFCRETFVYAPHIVRTAEAYVAEMGGFGTFSSLHVRRNELQYKTAFVEGAVTADNIKALINPGERVYLATDETKEGFFDRFRELGIQVSLMSDLRERVHARVGPVDPKYEGMIEQMVCASGRIFVGTMYSSFSAHIHRLRGYMHPPSAAGLRASPNEPSPRGYFFHTTDYSQPGAISTANIFYKGNFKGEVDMAMLLTD